MPSSTSSSEAVFERSTPVAPWSRSLLIAVVVCLVFVTVWELRVRALGYAPSVNDTSDRWSLLRSQVGREPGQTVVIGSSRIQFDLDLDSYARLMGVSRPLQLAMPGTNPLALLEHVAEEPGFVDGTLLLGVVAGLWFVPEGMPVDNAKQAIGRYDNWSPSQRAGLVLATPLQKGFAFINPDDLTLTMLLRRLPVADREAAKPNLPPVMPAYFAGMDEHRQARMWDRCDFGSERAALIQRTWIPLFTPPPPPPHLSPEEFGEMMKANAGSVLGRIAAAVAKVKARGVRVVFICPPSTDQLLELENKFAPREQTWDAILQAAQAPGIHFQDHRSLAEFDCPEWSHLSAADAVRYTEALVPLIREALESGS